MRSEEAHLRRIYDVLVETCGATDDEDNRLQFATFWHKPEDDRREYRFSGALGFGGKIRVRRDRWYVDCYPEDVTKERLEMIEAANAQLEVLRREERMLGYDEEENGEDRDGNPDLIPAETQVVVHLRGPEGDKRTGRLAHDYAGEGPVKIASGRGRRQIAIIVPAENVSTVEVKR